MNALSLSLGLLGITLSIWGAVTWLKAIRDVLSDISNELSEFLEIMKVKESEGK